MFVVVDHAYRGHGWIYNKSFQVGIAISVSLRFPNTQIESWKLFVINACQRPKGAQGIVFDILEILAPL